MITFNVEGIDAMANKFQKLANALSCTVIENDAFEKARIIAEDARSRAPLGPTGNLKRSLIARLLDKRGNNPRTAIAAVDRKIAPHAHLIEFGTCKMSARPFFRPAVESHSEGIIGNIKERIDKC